MKELTHTACGGEIDIVWIYNDGTAQEVEFKCMKCEKSFSYEQGFD